MIGLLSAPKALQRPHATKILTVSTACISLFTFVLLTSGKLHELVQYRILLDPRRMRAWPAQMHVDLRGLEFAVVELQHLHGFSCCR